MRARSGTPDTGNLRSVGTQREILVDFRNPDLVQVSPHARLLTGVAFMAVGLGVCGLAGYALLTG